MKKLSIRAQLAVTFGGVILMLACIAELSISSISAQSNNFKHYVDGARARGEAAHLVMEGVGARAIAARNLVLVDSAADREVEKKIVMQAQQDLVSNLQKLNELARDKSVSDEDKNLIKKIEDVEKQYAPLALSIVDLALQGKKEEAILKMNTECRPLLAALVSATTHYANFIGLQSSAQIKEADAASSRERNLIILLSIISVAVSVGAGILISHKLLKALGAEPADLCAAVARVADGDLTAELNVASTDTRSVMAAIKRMQSSLSAVVLSVRQDANTVSRAAAEISSGNIDLSARTEQQAGSLEETASSMEELTSTVRQNTDNAQQANTLALAASDIATRGGNVVSQVVGTMDSINEASRKIVDIISVIDGIAFQTNILALNAAVEAARAGEQGRGFAVVASEVRNLAQRSASAAKNIKVLIDDSAERVDLGTRLVADAGATMSEVVDSVKRVTSVLAEIVSASQEQSSGIEQINHAMTEMDHLTQRNASLVEESAAAAESLRAQAGNLVHAVSIFKLFAEEKSHKAMTSQSPALKIATNAKAVKKSVAESTHLAPHAAGSARPSKPKADAVSDWEAF